MVHVSLLGVSVVCCPIGRRIKHSKKQTEDVGSQVAVKEPDWQENIVVLLI